MTAPNDPDQPEQGPEGPQEGSEGSSGAEPPVIGPGGRWLPPPPAQGDGQVLSPDLLARMRDLVQVAVGQHRMGEQVDYLVGASVLNHPDGALVPVFGVTLAIPSYLIGQRVQGTGVISDLWMGADEVDSMVAEMLEALRGSRSQAMNGLGPEGDFPG